ncbi:MAG TPA: M4 family metallopeptidase [Nocardioides sp.]|nr:M4 family metallopeptidase [Nocardioides sp.]
MARKTLAGAVALAVSFALVPAATGLAHAASHGHGHAVTDDADGAVRELRSGGVTTFVGAKPGTRIDDPDVTPGMSVSAAARAHLDRYGAAFGANRTGTALVESSRTTSPAGTDVVRFGQEVGGLPVVAAGSVVTMRPDHELTSVAADLSSATAVQPAVVGETAARATALGRLARSTRGKGATAVSAGRWLFDPAVVGMDADGGPRSVWRFEVRSGPDARRLVLVDDQSGRVALDLDLINDADRVVCDKNNIAYAGAETPCTSGFARVEGGAPKGQADVDSAYDLAGATSEFYQQVGGIDLTDLIGYDAGGTGDKKLSSTVRVCFLGEPCPMANAFWNGIGMYYGQGYAVADDVVAHEMTHGVTERTSNLFYWGQSGAINESISDVIGEIVDHRNPGPGDSPSNWQLGEDLPGGALRDALNPPAHDDAPDRMTSPNWWTDPNYDDNGGVHINSGVGNKTFYLISQGGTFNGQAITGIDAGDDGLTKSGVLWIEVDKRLSSGSDYADLGVVLDQACSDLVGTHGFVASTCTQVHKATLATELAKTPPNDPHPADAPATCPVGTKQVLFSSEGGTLAQQQTKFAAGPTWVRDTGTDGSGAPSNAHSGQDSWATPDPAATVTSTLAVAGPIALPAGQHAYLRFQNWYDLDAGPDNTDVMRYYDGGTVEIDDRGDAAAPASASALPWVNGPTRPLEAPNAGLLAWSGDSRGYLASRVDLSSYAGRAISPQFTLHTDSAVGFTGWFLDDIEVYTCKPSPLVVGKVVVKGRAQRGKKLTASASGWPAGTTLAFSWLRNGKPIAKATKGTLKLGRKDVGKKISVRVTGSKAGYLPSSVVSKRTKRVLR